MNGGDVQGLARGQELQPVPGSLGLSAADGIGQSHKQVRYPCSDRALMDEIRFIWVNFERRADSPNC